MRKQTIGQWLAVFWLLTTIAVLSACHRQQKTVPASASSRSSRIVQSKKAAAKSSAQPSAKPQPAATILTRLRAKPGSALVYAPFGDSLSVGLFADSKESRFTTLFAQQLAAATGKKVHEQGLAIVGKTAANLGVPQVQTIVAQKPDIVTIEFGTNDAVSGQAPATLAAFKAQLIQIVTTLQQQTSAQLILMTTWSPTGGTYASNDAAFDAQIKAVGQANNVPVADLQPIWQDHPEVVGPVGKTLPDFAAWGPRDAFHPNQTGHDRIARALMQLIKQEE